MTLTYSPTIVSRLPLDIHFNYFVGIIFNRTIKIQVLNSLLVKLSSMCYIYAFPLPWKAYIIIYIWYVIVVWSVRQFFSLWNAQFIEFLITVFKIVRIKNHCHWGLVGNASPQYLIACTDCKTKTVAECILQSQYKSIRLIDIRQVAGPTCTTL